MTGRECTTIKIGGPMQLQHVGSLDELKAAKFSYVLGAGSNLLISDAGLGDAQVIKLTGVFKEIKQISATTFRVGAAVSMMQLSRQLSEQGLSGLEFAGGIPGTVGGAVVMNAGAHGGDFGSVVQEVEVVGRDGEVKLISRKELSFGYRSSNLPMGSVVTAATIELVRSTRNITLSTLDYNLAYRKRTQPLTLPSLGSVFRNPTPSAGLLISQVHRDIEVAVAQGIRELEVSTVHSNWIVNPRRKGTSAEFLELVQIIKKIVFKRFGVVLKEEFVVWN